MKTEIASTNKSKNAATPAAATAPTSESNVNETKAATVAPVTAPVTAVATPTPTPTAVAPAAAPTPALKKGPSPVFSIPATKADKDFISLQSSRTGVSQKDLLKLAIETAREVISKLPKYVEPAPEVAVKSKKAADAEAALAQIAAAQVAQPVAA